jgi:hypothetical protein
MILNNDLLVDKMAYIMELFFEHSVANTLDV